MRYNNPVSIAELHFIALFRDTLLADNVDDADDVDDDDDDE